MRDVVGFAVQKDQSGKRLRDLEDVRKVVGQMTHEKVWGVWVSEGHRLKRGGYGVREVDVG